MKPVHTLLLVVICCLATTIAATVGISKKESEIIESIKQSMG